MLYGEKIVGVGCRRLGVDGMGYVAGIIDSCGSVRNNRVRVNCPPHVLAKVVRILDSYTIPYTLDLPYLTISQEEGLILLYGCTPLVCSTKKATLKRMVERICTGGLEPYLLPTVDDEGWLQGVMAMRGTNILTGKNEWYSITHTDTDLVKYLGQTLTKMGIDYNLYTVERVGRRTLYNIRVYKISGIKRLLELSTTA
ncbi:hypothetical protein [Microcoleus phage My-WqHQDG]|nr:hypothetical protein [Microcoleus phage My-WqHQDG]